MPRRRHPRSGKYNGGDTQMALGGVPQRYFPSSTPWTWSPYKGWKRDPTSEKVQAETETSGSTSDLKPPAPPAPLPPETPPGRGRAAKSTSRRRRQVRLGGRRRERDLRSLDVDVGRRAKSSQKIQQFSGWISFPLNHKKQKLEKCVPTTTMKG